MKITNIYEIERFFKQYMVYDSCEDRVISHASAEATNEDYEESDGIITFMYESNNKIYTPDLDEKSFSNLQEAITYLKKYGTIVYKQLGDLTFKDTILLLDNI